MIHIAYDHCFAHALPEGHRFPMLKYELIPLQLMHLGLIKAQQLYAPDVVSEEWILQVHDAAYWQKLKDLSLSALEVRRLGFPLSKELVLRELKIAQGSINGAIAAIEQGIAFNVAGGTHHAGKDWAEGFCLLNDQAIAAAYLLKNKLASRILIVDLDVHQGNGTANIFKDWEQVFTFSMHGARNFPFHKEKSDRDVPLEDGISDEEYLALLKHHLEKLMREFKPDFVFYQAGVDVLATDKLGKLKLSEAACMWRDLQVIQYCKDKHIPLQVSMGGGYSAHIKDIVNAHCNTFKIGFELFQ